MWLENFRRNGLSVSYNIYFDRKIEFDDMTELYSSEEENDFSDVEFIRRTTSKFHNACCECDSNMSKNDSTNKFQKVTFAEKVQVRPMYVWAFASKKVRLDGREWLYESLSRRRFTSKIKTYYAPLLEPVIMSKHKNLF